MAQLILDIPNSLHQQLRLLANSEDVPMEKYALYALSRQVIFAGYLQPTLSSKSKFDYDLLRGRQAEIEMISHEAFDAILADGEPGEPEPDFTPELEARIRAKIASVRSE